MLKILLVDDEKTVLDGMEFLLKKHFPNHNIVGKVQSGTDALELVQNNSVDLVLTDIRMPKMDGIELITIIKQKFPNCICIVLSAYSDFEYVRPAMKNGAFDYLLKPCSVKDMLAALNKVWEQVQKNRNQQKKNSEIKKIEQKILGNKDFTSYINSGKLSQIIMVKMRKKNIVLKDNILENWCNENGSGLCYSLFIDGDIIFILQNKFSKNILDNFLDYIKTLYPSDFIVKNQVYITSINIDGEKNLETQYENCKKQLDITVFNNIIYSTDSSIYEAVISEFPEKFGSEFLDKFKGYFMEKNLDSLNIYISKNIYEFFNFGKILDPYCVKKIIFSNLLGIDNILLKYKNTSIEKVIGDKIDFLNQLQRLIEKETLFNWYSNICHAVIQCCLEEDTLPSYIYNAVNYIKKEYMNPISLKQVAEYVYLNEWYFSTQFKRYIGQSFSEYLNQIRVEESQKLLKQKDMRISNVAQMVGFQDQAYFSLVFKRIMNQTPKQFQKSNWVKI